MMPLEKYSITQRADVCAVTATIFCSGKQRARFMV